MEASYPVLTPSTGRPGPSSVAGGARRRAGAVALLVPVLLLAGAAAGPAPTLGDEGATEEGKAKGEGAQREEDEVARGLRPLQGWLAHADPVLRALAAFELRRRTEPGALRLLVRMLVTERDEVALGCALGGLVGRPRVDLVAEGGSLLPALLLRTAGHPSGVIRERAAAVLETLAGPRGTGHEGPGGWEAWWIRTRRDLDAEQVRLLEARRAAARAQDAGTAGTPSPTDPVGPPDLYEHVQGLRRDGLEVAVVMDHTGSMAPVIGVARARAASLVRRLSFLVPRFRAGLVTYDDAARLRLPLTDDAEAVARAFARVSAGGGGDWEEGVDRGVALALRQDAMGWSRRAHRVVIVIGDAPPHLQDVDAMLRAVAVARDDVLYEHPVVVHAVSTGGAGVEHFGALAAAGGGSHVTLRGVGRLEAEIVALSFGSAFRDRVVPWLEEVERLLGARRTDRDRNRTKDGGGKGPAR